MDRESNNQDMFHFLTDGEDQRVWRNRGEPIWSGLKPSAKDQTIADRSVGKFLKAGTYYSHFKEIFRELWESELNAS